MGVPLMIPAREIRAGDTLHVDGAARIVWLTYRTDGGITVYTRNGYDYSIYKLSLSERRWVERPEGLFLFEVLADLRDIATNL